MYRRNDDTCKYILNLLKISYKSNPIIQVISTKNDIDTLSAIIEQVSSITNFSQYSSQYVYELTTWAKQYTTTNVTDLKTLKNILQKRSSNIKFYYIFAFNNIISNYSYFVYFYNVLESALIDDPVDVFKETLQFHDYFYYSYLYQLLNYKYENPMAVLDGLVKTIKTVIAVLYPDKCYYEEIRKIYTKKPLNMMYIIHKTTRELSALISLNNVIPYDPISFAKKVFGNNISLEQIIIIYNIYHIIYCNHVYDNHKSYKILDTDEQI